jgi:ABC-type amino acid transport substrate-binding protein
MAAEIKPLGEWSRDTWFGFVGVVLSVIGIVIGIVVVKEARDWVRDVTLAYWRLGLIVLFAAGVIAAIWRTFDLQGTKAKLRVLQSGCQDLKAEKERLEADLRATATARDEAISEGEDLRKRLSTWRPYTKDPRGRWETVTQIKFGHLAYHPFLEYPLNGAPSGLGVEWLRELLGFSLHGSKIEVLPEKQKRDWGNIIEGLTEGRYDVVATPLFATFDRSKQVAFTAPLFFSNIGLYVSKETSELSVWKNIRVDGLDSAIKRAGKLEFLSVKGEISEKLANKYTEKESINSLGGGIILSSLFGEIARSNASHQALFCESFYAQLQPEVKDGAVVNVLPLPQILYPVCFALRLGDYQLANLLNIRLLRFTQGGGAFPRLAERLAKTGSDHLTEEEIKRHFVAEWPSPVAGKGGAHA